VFVSADVRHPSVAGKFYPRDPRVLAAEIHGYLKPAPVLLPAIGCVVPHAGYMYSGHVAGAVYSRLQPPPRCIVLCPNHTGMGKPLSIVSRGVWETPLGEVPVDHSLAQNLKDCFPLLTEDGAAHRAEHAIEVQLPFLQVAQPDLVFVPIALGTANPDVLVSLGEAIAQVLSAEPERVLIVASSDMNHYAPDDVTRIKDAKAINRILELDARGLYDVIMTEEISMCGFGPAMAMLTATRRLGATKAELVKYATSGDVSLDRDAVVGYAGIVVV
jgi:AmmeMemoRadiSam system protein B